MHRPLSCDSSESVIELSQTGETPRLIVLGGFAGSGKSTLGRSLSADLSVPAYDVDLVAAGIERAEDFHGTRLEAKGIAFALLWRLCKEHLRAGLSVVFDQNMGQPWQWGKLREVVASVPGAELNVFLLECPYQLCVDRAMARTDHPDQEAWATLYLGDHMLKWVYLFDNEFPEAIRVDATRDAKIVHAEVAALIRRLWRR